MLQVPYTVRYMPEVSSIGLSKHLQAGSGCPGSTSGASARSCAFQQVKQLEQQIMDASKDVLGLSLRGRIVLGCSKGVPISLQHKEVAMNTD